MSDKTNKSAGEPAASLTGLVKLVRAARELAGRLQAARPHVDLPRVVQKLQISEELLGGIVAAEADALAAVNVVQAQSAAEAAK